MSCIALATAFYFLLNEHISLRLPFETESDSQP